MSEKKVTVSDVAITTATIEVKVMRIGNRQMTLAVFRQLTRERIIDPKTGKLRGTPWGRVNYCPGDCGTAEHIHVVWQKGAELRQSMVTSNHLFGMLRPGQATPEQIQAYYQSYAQLEQLDQLFIAV